MRNSPTAVHLSRRSLLRTAVATALAAGLSSSLVPGTAHAADEYDTLRARWRGLLLGSGYDPANPLFATPLNALGTQAQTYHSSMAPTSASLWPDLPYSSTGGDPVTASYSRLKTMALAYAQPGTGLTGSSALASDIVSGLDQVYAHVYNATYTPSSSWWWNTQIGSAQALLDTCVLIYDQLSATQITNYCNAVDHFLPDSRVSVYTGQSTGANRVDFCHTLALRGVVGKDSAKLALARDALSPVFPYVTSGDGFYTDGSFIQHLSIPYTGSYGAVLLSGVAWLLALLAGSSWQVTDPNRQLVLDAVEKSFAPFIYNGLVIDNVAGRAISRGLSTTSTNGFASSDHARGQGILAAITMLGMSAGTAEQSRWNGLVKGWLQRDYYLPLASNPSLDVATLARLSAVANDTTVTAIAEPTAQHKLFPAMARAVHRRPGWAASVSMSSSSVAFYEYGNTENKRGWHTGSGMLYWWKDVTLGQFSDAFWPTVDPYRLPGTTVSRKVLADGQGGDFGAPKPSATWVGGATDGSYATIGMDTRGLASTLAGRKSWFFLDDSVVCLGAGFGCTDGTAVESTVENRNLGATGTHTLTVDGVDQPSTQGWSTAFSGAGWATLAGFAGYVFPGGASIKALREERTGAWSDINGLSGSTTPFTRRYVTLWFDHGTNPTSGSYQYILIPGADTTATAARAADTGWLTVLANSANQQGVRVPSLGFTAVNFFGGGTVGELTASAGVSVMVTESGGKATIGVADPTKSRTTVDVTWNRPVTSVAAQDPSVTVLGTGSSVRLRIDLTAKAGATHHATVVLT